VNRHITGFTTFSFTPTGGGFALLVFSLRVPSMGFQLARLEFRSPRTALRSPQFVSELFQPFLQGLNMTLLPGNEVQQRLHQRRSARIRDLGYKRLEGGGCHGENIPKSTFQR
jgi:hypothetical protein